MMYILGTGDHAREIASILFKEKGKEVEFAGPYNSKIQNALQKETLVLGPYDGVIMGIANPIIKDKVHKEFMQKYPYRSLSRFVSKHAILLSNVEEGLYVAPFAFISHGVSLGKCVTINYHVSVGHDTNIGNYSTILPGTRVGGNVSVGERVIIGANACIKERITIANDVTIGMGAAVVKDILEPGTYVGVPAKRIY